MPCGTDVQVACNVFAPTACWHSISWYDIVIELPLNKQKFLPASGFAEDFLEALFT